MILLTIRESLGILPSEQKMRRTNTLDQQDQQNDSQPPPTERTQETTNEHDQSDSDWTTMNIQPILQWIGNQQLVTEQTHQHLLTNTETQTEPTPRELLNEQSSHSQVQWHQQLLCLLHGIIHLELHRQDTSKLLYAASNILDHHQVQALALLWSICETMILLKHDVMQSMNLQQAVIRTSRTSGFPTGLWRQIIQELPTPLLQNLIQIVLLLALLVWQS